MKKPKIIKLHNLTYKAPENTGGSSNVNYNRLARWGRWSRDGDQDGGGVLAVLVLRQDPGDKARLKPLKSNPVIMMRLG